jgi:penicillin-binding protein 1B
MARTRRGSGRKKRRRRRRRRPGKLRTLVALSATGIVVLAAGWLYLDVSVRTRFEGRLWSTPARIYSDPLVLSVGERSAPEPLSERLERSGYAKVAGRPRHPGQYRRRGGSIELFARAFGTPVLNREAAWYRLRYSGNRISRVEREDGQATRHAVLEPELIATLHGVRQEERSVVPLEQIPATFRSAVLAAEDARFYEHHGLDLRGILRAAVANLKSGRIVQGGSTITQQTVKNLYLGQQRTWWRKMREAAMAWSLDRSYTKDRIFEVYLNEVYFGQRGSVAICGAQAAARFYFGRDLERLTIGEWATLAGMIRSPGSYNPFREPESALRRRDQVLAAMVRLGWLEAEVAAGAREERLTLASGRGGFSGAGYVVDYVRAELDRRFGVDLEEAEGVEIYTTIDTSIQNSAEQALVRGLERLERDVPSVAKQLGERRLQGAVVVTRPRSGEILALVGGRDYGTSQFNRVVQARRQPGSCFKPLVYAAGFELARDGDPSGLNPATILADEPIEIAAAGGRWTPSNYDREFRGAVTVREALQSSLNVPTVRAAQRVGLERIVEVAEKAGISSRLSRVPSLALGTEEVTPLELATAYGTFAQLGERRDAWIVRSVTGPSMDTISAAPLEPVLALHPTSAFLTTDLLRGVFDEGTARSARTLGFDGVAAGKTGTTDDTRDSWFVGYTPELLALVWVGFDDNARTGLTGASGALPIWVDLMRDAGVAKSRRRFKEPVGIVHRYVDAETGGLAAKRCPNVVEERFARGSEPKEHCPLHQGKLRRWWRRLTGQGDQPADTGG